MVSAPYDPSLVERILGEGKSSDISAEDWSNLKSWLSAIKAQDTLNSRKIEKAPQVTDNKNEIKARRKLQTTFEKVLSDFNITSGRVAEIGGPFNSFGPSMPNFEFQYLSLYPVKGRDDVLVADITQCDYLESEQFDVIFSVSVLEHVSKPWLAAEQMSRLLKPGGIMFHSAPFSYFYHGAPADFWRYTPDAMRLIFSELEPISAEFNGMNRRRDNRGSPSNAVDKDGGAAFAVDAFGGWRENWSTVYVGRKNPEWLAAKMERHRLQLVLNLIK
jgi:SAM-dependent methyltransferase